MFCFGKKIFSINIRLCIERLLVVDDKSEGPVQVRDNLRTILRLIHSNITHIAIVLFSQLPDGLGEPLWPKVGGEGVNRVDLLR